MLSLVFRTQIDTGTTHHFALIRVQSCCRHQSHSSRRGARNVCSLKRPLATVALLAEPPWKHKCKPWLDLRYLYAPQPSVRLMTNEKTDFLTVCLREGSAEAPFAETWSSRLVQVRKGIALSCTAEGIRQSINADPKADAMNDIVLNRLLSCFKEPSPGTTRQTPPSIQECPPFLSDCVDDAQMCY